MNKTDFKGEYSNSHKSQYVCPDMEDIEHDETLAFTLSPLLSHIGVSDEKYQIEQDPLHWLHNLLKDLEHKLHYCRLTELRVEASSKGRLHLHGWINITNILFFYTNDLPALAGIGSFAIKSLFATEDDEDPEYTWNHYICKQDAYWVPYFNDNILTKYKMNFEYPINKTFSYSSI